LQHRVEVNAHQIGNEQEQPTELGRRRPRRQVELAHIGYLGCRRSCSRGALVVSAARQPCEPLFLQQLGNGRRAQSLAALGCQRLADLVNRVIVLAQRHHPVAQRVALGLAGRPALRLTEEGTIGVVAELMAQHAEAAGGVAEAAGNLGGRQSLDEVGAQRLVLTMGRACGLEEGASEIR